MTSTTLGIKNVLTNGAQYINNSTGGSPVEAEEAGGIVR